MKTKIRILIASCMIAAVAISGINLVQDNDNMVVTLEDMIVTAKADGESGSDRGPMCYDSSWRAGCKLENNGFCSTSAAASC